MMRLLKQNQKQPPPMPGKRTAPKPIVRKEMSSSPQSCSLSGSVVVQDSGILASVAKAEGLNDYVLSKCYENQACSNVPDNLKETTLYSKPISGNTMSSSLRSYSVSGSVIAQDSGILASMVNAEGLNSSILSKCNKKPAYGDVQDTLKETSLHCQASDSGSAASGVEDCEPVTGKSDLNSSYKIVSVEDRSSKMDVNLIRETFRKRRKDRITNRRLVEDKDDDMDSEDWIERVLENGIKLESG